jgi:hypothetical protein
MYQYKIYNLLGSRCACCHVGAPHVALDDAGVVDVAVDLPDGQKFGFVPCNVIGSGSTEDDEKQHSDMLK